MIFSFSPSIQNIDNELGYTLCNSSAEVCSPSKKEVELFTYLLHSNNDLHNFNDINIDYTFEYFEAQKIFNKNQAILLNIANGIFKESRSLDELEKEILDEVFFESIKKKPTLKGRR